MNEQLDSDSSFGLELGQDLDPDQNPEIQIQIRIWTVLSLQEFHVRFRSALPFADLQYPLLLERLQHRSGKTISKEISCPDKFDIEGW